MKNKSAQALRALAKPENMARTKEQAKKASKARWDKYRLHKEAKEQAKQKALNALKEYVDFQNESIRLMKQNKS